MNKSDGKNCFKLSNTIESIPQYCPKNHTAVRKTFGTKKIEEVSVIEHGHRIPSVDTLIEMTEK